MQQPSLSHNLPLLGCFCGTFNPSCLQILSTRLWFTRHPSTLSRAVILRYPYRPYRVAKAIIWATSLSSSPETTPSWRCVDRAWPSTLHARRWEIRRLSQTHLTAFRLRDG